jgi:FHA domain-containing protein
MPAPTPAAVPAGAGVQAAGLKQVQGLDLSMFDRGPGATAEIPVAPEATVFSHIDADLAPTQLLPMRRAAAPVAVPSLDLDLDRPPVPMAPMVPPVPAAAQAPPPKAAAPTLPAEPPAPAPAVPPPAVPLPAVQTTPAVAPAAASSSLSADEQQALLNAFIEGIGLTPDQVKAELTPEFMRRFGQAYRTAVQGTMDLLHARSEIKRELRSDVTIMATRANNPLKFLPDADGVMMQMVGQTFPGFMLPVPAMQEAFRDLRVHQLALMAGIRAAYAEALTRFDPQQLEKHAAEPGGLLAKLASTRHKAALWDDYKQRYADIRRHAEDDLTAFSGRTFVKAYDAAADAAEDQAFGPAGKLP